MVRRILMDEVRACKLIGTLMIFLVLIGTRCISTVSG